MNQVALEIVAADIIRRESLRLLHDIHFIGSPIVHKHVSRRWFAPDFGPVGLQGVRHCAPGLNVPAMTPHSDLHGKRTLVGPVTYRPPGILAPRFQLINDQWTQWMPSPPSPFEGSKVSIALTRETSYSSSLSRPEPSPISGRYTSFRERGATLQCFWM